VTITQRSRNPHRRRSGLAVAAAAVVALALIGAACGDDDDDTAADNAGGTTETTAADTAAADTAAFCDARIQLEQEFNADQPDAQAITGLLEDLQASAPSDLAANVEGISTLLASAAESGSDPSEDPAFTENVQPIDEFALEQCGDQTVEVTAADYSFEGLPETLDAGTTGFKLTNEGSEQHVLVVFKFNDGDTTSLEDLLALPEDQAQQHATFVGAASAAPGDWGSGFMDLEPGRYAAFCPIPMGGEDGPPHFTQGMSAEFEVA
jgi:hypothetical protein